MLTHSIDRLIDIRMELNASQNTIMGDPTQLHSAMLNLGLNARDAMSDGGTLTYTTRNMAITKSDCDKNLYNLTPGDFLEIRITDTGVGMSEDIQKKIFEPFFTTKEVGKGTGLGLAGVYGCVRNHDGNISVSSKPGQGTTFTILLPLTDTSSEPTDKTAISDEPAKGSGHILIVDDEESVRSFVGASLRSMGYTVATGNDGLEGLEYYREHHQEIDLVILDLIMPKMNGQVAFMEMKKINPDVKVLVSSGFSSTETSRQMLHDGVLDMLNKPFQVATLAETVAKYIRPGN
ncbi:MAG: response regulator [bacterium]|nr:response regulator [bacterium]